MKKILLCLLMAILLANCSNNDSTIANDNIENDYIDIEETQDTQNEQKTPNIQTEIQHNYETVEQQEVYNDIERYFGYISEYDRENIDKYWGEHYLSGYIRSPSKDAEQLISQKIDYKVNNININVNKDTAFVKLDITGVDLSKIYYEFEMLAIFLMNTNYEPSYINEDITAYIVNRNIDNIKNTPVNITLNKVNGEWEIVKDVILRDAIAGSSIDYNDIYNRAYDNYFKYIKLMEDLYYENSGLTIDEYVREECIIFIDNYFEVYIDFYSFEEVFMHD